MGEKFHVIILSALIRGERIGGEKTHFVFAQKENSHCFNFAIHRFSDKK